jgi:uncharacterized protein YggL (DUF469 family)
MTKSNEEKFDQFIQKVIGSPPKKEQSTNQESFDEFIKKVKKANGL